MSDNSGNRENWDCDVPMSEDITSKSYTFARPSIVTSPEKVISFGIDSEHVFSKPGDRANMFTFAVPASISQLSNLQKTNDGEKAFVPKISRNVFAQSISPKKSSSSAHQENEQGKLLEDFDQLKRNSKSHPATRGDIANSITCTNVPESLLNKAAAKEYFAQFGQIVKITLRPKKQSITICYSTKDAATDAYYKAGSFLGETFGVQWSSSDTPVRAGKKTESTKDMVRKFLKADNEEVNAELAAMMGLEYNMHGDTVTNPILEAKPRVRKVKPLLPKESLRSSKPEKVAVKVEKMDTEQVPKIVIPKETIEELRNIIRQAAYTSEDRYKILEARDRLIRLKQIKPNTLAAAKVTRGTCPDMCPEKERLMRESQRQVAVYELLEGRDYRINHVKAIKQYSRSSADQEEPLAHELRPVACLNMTMSYLLHEIMDMCMSETTNLAEWFHFLWDRTRGIRKDITQQELCCVNSVELVEQCARFHIVCSERLCAEDPSAFDKKINTENLTKCLQTLKYMYHDLRMKGVVCRNEAEFRGYVILLNLNDGNFMWDVQKLPTDIQKSPDVRFAIEVYSSIESNNFSKFFKLVRRTTYLNACILLRYFNQVRVTALSIMVKAYYRNTSTQFPLYELIDILGFEDESETIYFCEQVGLNLSNDEMHILLSRQTFTHPITTIEQGRAINVVESKRTKAGISVGQCVAGNVLPSKSYKNHVIHDSFDANGFLKAGALIAEDQLDGNKSAKKDVYDFTEEEMPTPPKQLVRPKFVNQTDPGLQRKSDVVEPATKLFGEAKTIKRSSLFSAAKKVEPPSNPNPFYNKDSKMFAPPSSVPQNVESNPPFARSEFKTPFSTVSFGSKQFQKPVDPESRGSDTPFGSNRGMGIFSKQDNITSLKPTDNIQTATPFAMSLNKSIFSGGTKANAFSAPSTTVPSIFRHRNDKGEGVGIDAKQSTTKTELGEMKSKSEPVESELERKKREQLEAQARLKKMDEVKRQLELEKAKLREMERERALERIEASAKETAKELEEEVIQEICGSLVKEELDRANMYNALATNITDLLVCQVVCDFCDSLLKEELRIERKLREISERMARRLISKYYKRWRQNSTKNRRQRLALDNTPVWIQDCTVDESARLLYRPEQDLVIDSMRRKRVEEEPPPQNPGLAPVELIVYLGMKENPKLSDVAPKQLFWKLVISWPHLEHRLGMWRQKNIMNNYLNPKDFTEDPILKVYKPNPYETLHVCVRHFEGIINERYLVGTDGLLFLAASSETMNAVKRRLSKTILSGSRLVPIPVVVAFLGADDLRAEDVEQDLDLEVLLECGYISEYTLIFEKEMSEKKILRITQSTVLWLTANRPRPVPLEMDYLHEVVENCLTRELWFRIQGHADFNPHLARGLNDPTIIIALHNEGVGHLVDILLDPESLIYTEFATEFKPYLEDRETMPISYEYFDDAWKKEDNRENIEQIASSLLLPDWKYTWPIMNVPDLHDALRNYCLEACPDSNCTTTTREIMSRLLLMTDDLPQISFINVLLEFVRRKILHTDRNVRVVYNKNHIKNFRQLPWWFKSDVLLEDVAPTETSFAEEHENEEQTVEEPAEKRARLEDSDEYDDGIFDTSLFKPNDSLKAYCNNTREQISNVRSVATKFEKAIEEQKERNKKMEELLQQALMEEDVML